MDRDEFIAAIDFGSDIMFNCAGKKYTILGWFKPGPNIAEQVTEANEAVFRDGADLVDNYRIDGVPLAAYLDRIEVTYMT